MKKIITLMIFFILFIYSFSTDFSNNSNISIQSIVLEEELQLIIPTTKDSSSQSTFVVDLNKLEKDIYPSKNQIVLINNRGQKLHIIDNLKWFKLDDQTFVSIEASSNEELIKFLDNSEDFDFHIFKTNVMYSVEDIPIEYFKNLHLIN